MHTYLFARERTWREAPEGVRYVTLSANPSDPARPMSVLSEYPPNHRVEAHTHGCDYMEIVLKGELTVGKVHLVEGDARIMKARMGYGPLISGPNGCRVLTMFDRAEGSMPLWLGKARNRIV